MAAVQQERAGYCARCEDQVLIRRQHRVAGWKDWRCTMCGTITPPLRDALPAAHMLRLYIALSVVGLFVALIAVAALR